MLSSLDSELLKQILRDRIKANGENFNVAFVHTDDDWAVAYANGITRNQFTDWYYAQNNKCKTPGSRKHFFGIDDALLSGEAVGENVCIAKSLLQQKSSI
jgi:hypothetical protein